MDVLEQHIRHITDAIQALTIWLNWLEAQRGRRVTEDELHQAMKKVYATDALVAFMESPVDCGPTPPYRWTV